MQSSGTCLGNGRTNSLAGVSSVPTAIAAALAEPLNAAPDCSANSNVCQHDFALHRQSQTEPDRGHCSQHPCRCSTQAVSMGCHPLPCDARQLQVAMSRVQGRTTSQAPVPARSPPAALRGRSRHLTVPAAAVPAPAKESKVVQHVTAAQLGRCPRWCSLCA